MCAQHNERTVDVFGTRGSAHSPWALHSLDEAWIAEAEETAAEAVDARRGEGRHTGYMRAVLDALDAGAPLPVGPEDARTVVELCAAIYESGITGRAVSLPLDATSLTYGGVSASDYANRRLAEAAAWAPPPPPQPARARCSSRSSRCTATSTAPSWCAADASPSSGARCSSASTRTGSARRGRRPPPGG